MVLYISIFVIAFALGFIANNIHRSSKIERKCWNKYKDSLEEIGKLPNVYVDAGFSLKTFREIDGFLMSMSRRSSGSSELSGYTSRWLKGERSVLISWIRYIHSCGCRIHILAVSSSDTEINKQVTHDYLRYSYRARYNKAFKQMTGGDMFEYYKD